MVTLIDLQASECGSGKYFFFQIFVTILKMTEKDSMVQPVLSYLQFIADIQLDFF